MWRLTLLTSNNGTMKITQEELDGEINVHTFHGYDDFFDHDNDITIPPGDMVMLINFYRHVKEHNIQNDFINPNGFIRP